jgi:uncharacterized coiled-coil protein SlyX
MSKALQPCPLCIEAQALREQTDKQSAQTIERLRKRVAELEATLAAIVEPLNRMMVRLGTDPDSVEGWPSMVALWERNVDALVVHVEGLESELADIRKEAQDGQNA